MMHTKPRASMNEHRCKNNMLKENAQIGIADRIAKGLTPRLVVNNASADLPSRSLQTMMQTKPRCNCHMRPSKSCLKMASTTWQLKPFPSADSNLFSGNTLCELPMPRCFR